MSFVIGLMSGTSLDGVDIALVDCEGKSFKQLAFETFDMPFALKREILQCCDIQSSNVARICSLNVKLGKFFGKCICNFMRNNHVTVRDILCIGSHGQTIYHQPIDEGEYIRSTLQIGEPAEIAYITKIPVISSFRAKDMAAGGQGAPLVPYTEFLIYSSSSKTLALQNIGGIGNVTLLVKNGREQDIVAFDTGPGNMVIDALMRKFYNKPYDVNGEVGGKGNVQEKLLDEWMRIPYISEKPPKSTGRELFGEQFVKRYVDLYPQISGDDFIATATMFTAKSIAHNYEKFLIPIAEIDDVVLSGGGSHNLTIIKMLKILLPKQNVITQEELGFSSDAKEAVAFAVLAYESFYGRIGNSIAATGASEKVILGNITMP